MLLISWIRRRDLNRSSCRIDVSSTSKFLFFEFEYVMYIQRDWSEVYVNKHIFEQTPQKVNSRKYLDYEVERTNNNTYSGNFCRWTALGAWRKILEFLMFYSCRFGVLIVQGTDFPGPGNFEIADRSAHITMSSKLYCPCWRFASPWTALDYHNARAAPCGRFNPTHFICSLLCHTSGRALPTTPSHPHPMAVTPTPTRKNLKSISHFGDALADRTVLNNGFWWSVTAHWKINNTEVFHTSDQTFEHGHRSWCVLLREQKAKQKLESNSCTEGNSMRSTWKFPKFHNKYQLSGLFAHDRDSDRRQYICVYGIEIGWWWWHRSKKSI